MNRIWFQRLVAFGLMLIVPIFIFSHYKILRAKKIIMQPSTKDFLLDNPYPGHRHFVFILPMNQEIAELEQHFNSIFSQNYDQYEVIAIDDGESSLARTEASRLASMYNKQHLLSFYELQSGEDLLHSYFTIVKSCRDQDIIVYLEQHDWLAHPNVLEVLNKTYSNEDVWLTYSQYMAYPSYRRGSVKPVRKRMITHKNVSRYPWVGSPIKTYYAGLLKQIDLEKESFSDPNQSFEEALRQQLAPLVELSKWHIRYIDDVLIIHNDDK